MKRSIETLEEISQLCHSQITIHKFNKNLELPLKYKKGRIDVLEWMNEMIFFYIQKEKHFLEEIKERITDQRSQLKRLKEGEYKAGMFDELNQLEEMINDRINNS